ncbi:type II secretion system F family protein [bacterium]|nr:type II secretion system F family protein [bacterium]
MANFIYQARTITGSLAKGKVEARDEADARIKLRAKQLIVVKLTVATADQMKGGEFEEAIKKLMAPKVDTKELKIFTRQFSTLINSGIPIADALKILSEGQSSRLLKETLIQIRASIDMGRRLSDSMIIHERVFDRLYCNMIQAGEEAGIIDTILLRLSTYIEKNEKIKSQVKGALVMPLLIMIVAFIVITGIIVFIIPKFQEFYAGSGKALPLLTQLIIDLSNTLRAKWFVYISVLVGVIGAVTYYINTPEGKKNLDITLINAPVIGDVVQKSSVARMTRTLSTLLSSGIGLIEAIEIASRTAGNYVIEKALADCKEAVTVGKPFHVPLSRQKEIPMMVSQMVGIGEQSGSLDIMLGKIADFYEEEVETAVKAMTSLIEPLMMVFLGGLIAIILVAMYLPIFSLGDTIG